MNEQKERTVYIGIIHSESFDSRILVTAKNEDEAMIKVWEKCKDSAGVFFRQEDVTIVPFSEGFK